MPILYGVTLTIIYSGKKSPPYKPPGQDNDDDGNSVDNRDCGHTL